MNKPTDQEKKLAANWFKELLEETKKSRFLFGGAFFQSVWKVIDLECADIIRRALDTDGKEKEG